MRGLILLLILSLRTVVTIDSNNYIQNARNAAKLRTAINDVDPFTINLRKQKSVSINLQKLFPNRRSEEVIRLGDLYVGILNRRQKCIEFITDEPIPYIRNDGLYNRNPALTFDITNEQFLTLIDDSQLVIVTHNGSLAGTPTFNQIGICGGKVFSSLRQLGESVRVLVREDLQKVESIPVGEDERCHSPFLSYDDVPGDSVPYFREIQTSSFLKRFGLNAKSTVNEVEEGVTFIPKHPERPLFGFGSHPSVKALFIEEPQCDIELLRKNLQYAIQLEWATLPLYLTGNFSIKPNQNLNISDIIHGVAIQEMLHFAQSANILIGVGQKPVIDATTQPVYPSTGLPGGVLKNLEVPLTKVTKNQVYNTFMGVEIPNNSSAVQPAIINNLYTIGAFYKDIEACIKELGDGIFKHGTEGQVNVNFGDKVGKLYLVDSVEKALVAIEQIVAQGEGEGPLNPDQVGAKGYAHFYLYEEIFCGKELIPIQGEQYYAYNGPVISFDPNGVYNMIDNPNPTTMQNAGPDCLAAAKNFSSSYKKLISGLQTAFTTNPNEIGIAINEMFTLDRIASDVLKVPFKDGSRYKCGPVWDVTFN